MVMLMEDPKAERANSRGVPSEGLVKVSSLIKQGSSSVHAGPIFFSQMLLLGRM
jgi:hypothetical protein